jgi:Protein of unknown function (DUF3179)
VYDPRIEGRTLSFGVSGKLYKSNLLLFDRQTDSLWSQLLQQAITGSLTGKKLVMVSAQHTTWELWRSQHPDSLGAGSWSSTQRREEGLSIFGTEKVAG